MLEFFFFGSPKIIQDQQKMGGFRFQKAQALVCYLVVTRRQHSRSHLAGLLWGELPEINAAMNLRKTLMNLRQLFGVHLQITRQQIAFNPDPPYRSDVATFEMGIAPLKTGVALTERNIDLITQATKSYTADFLEGFYVRDAPAFEAWASSEQDRLRDLLLNALREMTYYYASQQTYQPAIECAKRLLSVEPFDEGIYRTLMLLLAQNGQRSAALVQYDACRKLLLDELGVEPEAETTAFYRAIQSDNFAHLATQQLSPAKPDPAVMIAAHGQAATPAMKQFSSYGTSFVGRQKEIAEIESLLSSADCRLLTLVGPGGIGKTRLAIEAAQRFALIDGVHFVPLQPLTSSDFLVSAIAGGVSLQFYGSDDSQQQLLDHLREKSLLLVLDNFEHLLDRAALLADILAYAPGVKMLVTSRERLNLVEESVLDVSGLAYPSNPHDGNLEAYSAVELFVQHAHRAKASFALAPSQLPAVVRICRLVNGMPLGIELAATWVRALSCEAIADEIEHSLDILETPARNVEPRHRTMRAAFEPSWKRLAEGERVVFMKLSVFRGGFTREAAETIADASLLTLRSLVDKSLLRVDTNGRYDIHELLRQYGEGQLDASAEEAAQIRDRHCDYYATLLELSLPRLTGSEIKAALTQLDHELENLRTMWDWALRRRKASAIERALPAQNFFYDLRALYHEGEQAYARAAAVFSDDDPASIALYAKLRAYQGGFCHDLGLTDKASALLLKSVEILRRIEAYSDLADALWKLGVLYEMIDSDMAVASGYYQESIALYGNLGDRLQMAFVLHSLAFCYGIQGALDKAMECGKESLAIFEALDSHEGIGAAYSALGSTAYQLGEYELCKTYIEKSLVPKRESGSFIGIIFSLGIISGACSALGDYDQARRHLLEGLQTYFASGQTRIDRFTLGLMTYAARIWMGDGEIERGYELLALIDLEMRSFGTHRKFWAWSILDRLDDQLPPNLVAAVERGRGWTIDAAIQAVYDDFTRTLESGTRGNILQPFADSLKPREQEILQLLAAGRSNREIAEALFLAPSTVKWYVSDILSKLGVRNRTQAGIRARERGLID